MCLTWGPTRRNRGQSRFLAPRSIYIYMLILRIYHSVCICVYMCDRSTVCGNNRRACAVIRDWKWSALLAVIRRGAPNREHRFVNAAAATFAMTRKEKAAVCHDSCRDKLGPASEEAPTNAPARPEAYRCTLSTGNGTAFIESLSGSSPGIYRRKR